MKKAVLFIILFLIAAPASCQEFFEWRADPYEYATTPDQVIHFFAGRFVCDKLDKIMPLHWAVLGNVVIAAGLEAKDALIPHEKLPWIGGEGWNDWNFVYMGIAGSMFYVLTEYVIFKGDNYYLNLESSGDISRVSFYIQL